MQKFQIEDRVKVIDDESCCYRFEGVVEAVSKSKYHSVYEYKIRFDNPETHHWLLETKLKKVASEDLIRKLSDELDERNRTIEELTQQLRVFELNRKEDSLRAFRAGYCTLYDTIKDEVHNHYANEEAEKKFKELYEVEAEGV